MLLLTWRRQRAGPIGFDPDLAWDDARFIVRRAVSAFDPQQSAHTVNTEDARAVPLRQRTEQVLKSRLSTLEQSGSHQQTHEALPTADCGRSRQRDARDER